ncbi:MAG TPA: type II toxin-antitoxin system PemK/MazF family toxin [Bryobacteraceae bacterium]|nr:type II toxin-antitoxin system PemK/MazF family toxin [Bryobacteraceae bacterium]
MDPIQRGEIWWADLPEPRRSEPGYRRPVLVIQADSFNRSRIQTVIVAVITGNLELAEAPGNVVLPARSSGLPRDSVVNVSQVLTLDRGYLTEHAGTLPASLQGSVDAGLRTILQL